MNNGANKIYRHHDIDVHYYVAGSANAEAILFLHPAFADSQMFTPQFEHFSQNYFVIAMDMPGHGKSQLGRSKQTMAKMPEIIKAILFENSIEKVHIVGVSVGSLVAQSVAYQYPRLVNTVTMVGGYSIHKDNKDIIKAQRKQIVKWMLMIIFSMKKFGEYNIKHAVRSDLGEALFQKGFDQFTRKSFRAMSDLNKLFVPTEEPVPYPLLVLWGEHDIQLARDAGKNIAETEPKAMYKEIKDAGHCANVDNIKEFNHILEDFISRPAE